MLILPILLILILVVSLAIFLKRKGIMKWTEGKIMDIVLFLLSGVAMFISLGLFMNMALYVSNYQYNGNIFLVVGGRFWLNMIWLELPVLFFLTLFLGIRLIRNKK